MEIIMDSNLRQVNEFIKVGEIVDDKIKGSEFIKNIEYLNIPLYFKVGNKSSRERKGIYIKRIAPIDICLKYIDNRMPQGTYQDDFLKKLSFFKTALFHDSRACFSFSHANVLDGLDYPNIDTPMMIAVCGQSLDLYSYQFTDEIRQEYEENIILYSNEFEIIKFLKKENSTIEDISLKLNNHSLLRKSIRNIFIDSFNDVASLSDIENFIRETSLFPRLISKYFNNIDKKIDLVSNILNKILVEANLESFYTNNYYHFCDQKDKFIPKTKYWNGIPDREAINYFKSDILEVNFKAGFDIDFKDLYILKSDLKSIEEKISKERLESNFNFSTDEIDKFPENLRNIFEIIKILEKNPTVDKETVNKCIREKFSDFLSINKDKRLAFLVSLVKKKKNLQFNKKSNNAGMSDFLKLLCETYVKASSDNFNIDNYSDLTKAMQSANKHIYQRESDMVNKLKDHSWFLF